MLKASQGDAGRFKLQAWADKAAGKAFDLTGATYEGQIYQADGTLQTIPNEQFSTLSQAAEPSANGTRGQFTIDFTKEQSALWHVTASEFDPDQLLVIATQGAEVVARFRAEIVVKPVTPKRPR